MTKVIAERTDKRGRRLRLVDDGNMWIGIFTIEERRDYPDGVAWVNILTPGEMFRDINTAKREFLKDY